MLRISRFCKISSHYRSFSSSTNLTDLIREMSSTKKQKTDKPRHVRMKERGLNPGFTSKMNLQVVSNGYAGTSKSVVLNNDQTNYLFNCGEGTQRTLQEKNTAWELKFSKTKHLFLTRKSWETIGGLLGICISLKEAYLNEITFHAPCDVIDLLKHWKGLESFPNMKLEQYNYTNQGPFQDDCFKIHAIPLRSKSANDLVYAYLCETHPFPPSLSAELCAFHRIPPTEVRSRLKNGEDVTLPDGRLIRSKDVTLPGEPPVKILIFDCPSMDYFASVDQSGLNDHQYHAIIHMGPRTIFNDELYRSWMSKIVTNHHVLLDESMKNVHMEAIHRYQTQLNYVDSDIFPLLSDHQILSDKVTVPEPIGNICYGLTSTRIPIRPTLGPDQSKLITLQPQNYIDLILANEEFKQTFNAAQEQLRSLHQTGAKYPEIVFLGTGSACPSKPRNTSGILLHLDDQTIFLLECAEGTTGQIRHFYGDQTDSILTRIRFASISHMHADHLGGFYGFIRQRRQAFDNLQRRYEKILLLCPNKYVDVGRKQWNYFSSTHSFDDDVQTIFNRTLNNGLLPANNFNEEHQRLRSAGLQNVQTVLVEHIYDAHALVLRHVDGWSIAFSGDCKQSNNFIQAGQNVDVLIHESTYETGLEVYASQMRHCTMSQAIEVGKKMNAKYTILWHFSQRYAKIPFRHEEEEGEGEREQDKNKFCISFDFMRVRLADLPRACALVKIFESMFYEEWLMMKKRQTRREVEPDYLENNTRMIEAKRKLTKSRSPSPIASRQ